jgi:hypothetical protein
MPQSQLDFRQKSLNENNLRTFFNVFVVGVNSLSFLSVVSSEQACSDDAQTTQTASKRKHTAMFSLSAEPFLMLIAIFHESQTIFSRSFTDFAE